MKTTLLLLLIFTSVLGARTTPKLLDIDTTALPDGVIKAQRIVAFAVAQGNPHIQNHRKALADDILDDKARGLHPAGHRGGLRARLTWSDTLSFDFWEIDFKGIRSIGNLTQRSSEREIQQEAERRV